MGTSLFIAVKGWPGERESRTLIFYAPCGKKITNQPLDLLIINMYKNCYSLANRN